MAIEQIQIENYKSIKKCSLSLNDINILIGENGSGKTNVISAIKYFYDNLLSPNNDNNIFDTNNKYSNCIRISITYNLLNLQKRCKQQISKEKSSYIPYFQKIVDMGNEGIITLTLIKIKDRKIIWKGANDKERILIHDLIPIYYIDSRSLNLTDWSNLWEHIGDLVKTDDKTIQYIKKDVIKIINNQDYKLKKIYEDLNNSFININVKTERFTPKRYAKALSQLYFEGAEFDFDDNKLHYFSNGTNSFNYTKLLIQILMLISDKKMKSPFIIMDEPEISLHHKLIDELSTNIFDVSKSIQFIISTHSPRMIKNIMMKDSGNSSVFHVRTLKHYSYITKMRLFNEKNESKSKIRITDQHANAYFASLIFCIEGETELELFENKYIREIYPILKYTDVINKSMSDDVVKKIISPKIRRYSTPMISLVDMDKVMKKDEKNNLFIINEKFINGFDINNENYYYTYKRKNTYAARKRIYAMSKNCKFNYKLPFYSTEDTNYITLLDLIKSYFNEYGLIVAKTTAEGILINDKNQYIFWEFAKSNILNKSNLDEINNYYKLFSINNKLNFIRLLFNGKSDFILKLEQIKEINPNMPQGLYQIILNNRQGKTSGWVSKWIEYYICSVLDIAYNANSYKNFKMVVQNKTKLEYLQNRFKDYFPEIDEVTSIMIKAIENQS